MKSFFLFSIFIIYISSVYAEDYQIVKIEPDFLIPGTNYLDVTLNKEITEYDSVSLDLVFYENGIFQGYYFCHLLNCEGATIKTVVEIPQGAKNQIGNLNVSLMNTTTWEGVNINYDKDISIAGSIYGIEPAICMVGLDDSENNAVIWNVIGDETIDSVRIFKETSINEEFNEIGTVSTKEVPVFIDEQSSHTQNSSRYKIAYMDSAGTLSSLSPAHKTMHLMMNTGINGAINLIWEKYEGFDYSTFYIYRGSSKEDMVKIAEIASNLFSFTDVNPSFKKLYYQVVVENPSPCIVTQQKSALSDYSHTRSNLVEYISDEETSNESLKPNNEIKLYPNPVQSQLNIDLTGYSSQTILDARIISLNGTTLLSTKIQPNKVNSLNVENLNAGIYILEVSNKYNKVIKRFCVE